MDSRRLAYLKALDIDVWERRDGSARPKVAPVETVAAPVAPVATVQARTVQSPPPAIAPKIQLPDEDSGVSKLGWEELATAVRSCTKCPLHATRTNGVFGVGDRTARWMIVGEAPGADEDRQGEPFVGRAGQLLNSMLKAIGLAREQVFIANILKSRPPNNRDPKPEEVRACIPYLYRQIELVNPALILCVGRIAAQTLLEVDTPIGKLRGTVHRIATNRPMVVTYHPAYLLRSPVEKRKSWADLLLAMRTFETLQSGATT
ncbi:uracil-DNA glycosylase family protein [Steroidobacter flavus]|uniref:Type-4 uracil-DNA glycosylase n=1 Tax=Steroidobacter flavus TaxID=1842136 RepID=A0ABV8T6W8_9GAMM